MTGTARCTPVDAEADHPIASTRVGGWRGRDLRPGAGGARARRGRRRHWSPIWSATGARPVVGWRHRLSAQSAVRGRPYPADGCRPGHPGGRQWAAGRTAGPLLSSRTAAGLVQRPASSHRPDQDLNCSRGSFLRVGS